VTTATDSTVQRNSSILGPAGRTRQGGTEPPSRRRRPTTNLIEVRAEKYAIDSLAATRRNGRSGAPGCRSVKSGGLQRSVDVSPTNDCARLYRRAAAFAIGRFPCGKSGVDIDQATQTGVAFEQVTPDAGPFSAVQIVRKGIVIQSGSCASGKPAAIRRSVFPIEFTLGE